MSGAIGKKARRKRRQATVERPRSPPRIDAAKIISRLPGMSPHETIQLWLNALRILDDPARSADHGEVKKVLDGIETCWLMRRDGTPDGWFKWPITEAPGGDGALDGSTWQEEGPLKLLGYAVGHNGQPAALRERILTQVFSGAIPPAFPPAYMRGWGEPASPQRLEKMAQSIASFARSAKRRDPTKLAVAISDWERDLAHLHRTLYVGKFKFGWPKTT